MDSKEATPGIRVTKADGEGVTVVVYNANEEKVVARRPAGTRPEVDALAAEYGVPQEQVIVDADAQAALGAR